MVNLGTFILWFGWLGFNGGSAFGANLRAIMSIWNSMLAPAFGGIVWCLLDYRLERKFTMVGFCSGSIAALVAATPASGYIHPWAAIIMGIVSGAVCNFATKRGSQPVISRLLLTIIVVKVFIKIDDSLDLFAEHAIGGVIGLLFNGFFASHTIIALDGVNTNINGGLIDHNLKQLYIQGVYICATCGYAFIATAILAKVIDVIPGLHLRTTSEGEVLGLDETEVRLTLARSCVRVFKTELTLRLASLQPTILKSAGIFRTGRHLASARASQAAKKASNRKENPLG